MSSYFWNYLELSTPVIVSSPLNCNNAYGTVKKFRCIVTGIKNTLDDLRQLYLEAAALSRHIYRTKYKLRQEKSFKTLQMINRCLTNYLSIHLPFTVTSIQDTLIDDSGPSRQMLEWALVRLLSVAHLFHRVYSLCTLAAGHLFVRMKLMHMYETTFFAVAVVSRIWTYAQFIVRKACEWYSSLHPYLDKLQPSPHPWLPSGAVLPTRLQETLGNPPYLTFKSVRRPDELISQLDSSVSDADKTQINGSLPAVFDLDDIGETVSREPTKEEYVIDLEVEELTFHTDRLSKNTTVKNKRHQKVKNHQVLSNKQQINVENSSLAKNNNHKPTKTKDVNNSIIKNSCVNEHSIKGIRSSEDLIKFLEVESALRKTSSSVGVKNQPLTKNCDKLQWSMMERFMKKQIKLLSKSEAFGNLEMQEKLLKRVRKSIKSLVS